MQPRRLRVVDMRQKPRIRTRRSAFAAASAGVAMSLAATAWAQVQRNFPQDALRGAIVITDGVNITLNGDPARLAPGARIRSQDNMLQMSGALIGQRLLVNYTLDLVGGVKDVWILRPEEARMRPWPTTPEQAATWSFDPAAQVWTKP